MMVESEAYELTEDEMLGAVNSRHEQIQPVIDLIIAWPKKPRKSRSTSSRPITAALYDAVKAAGEDQDARRLCDHRQAGAQTAVAAAKEAIKAA
jgi:polyribonucleotide nucleotidyltransferase